MEDSKKELNLLLEFTKKMQKLPICCRIYLMKQLIYLIDFNIYYNDKHNYCYCYIEKN